MKVDYKFLKTVANSSLQYRNGINPDRANNFINTIYYSRRLYVLDLYNIYNFKVLRTLVGIKQWIQ